MRNSIDLQVKFLITVTLSTVDTPSVNSHEYIPLSITCVVILKKFFDFIAVWSIICPKCSDRHFPDISSVLPTAPHESIWG